MFDKKQVQNALKDIDDSLATLNGSREAHLVLTNDIQLIQNVCIAYFDSFGIDKGKEDVGTNKPTKRPKSGNKDK